jgi:hypothetical protein
MLKAMLVLFITQVPLDLSLIYSGTMSLSPIGIDIFVLSTTTAAILIFLPDRRSLFRIGPIRLVDGPSWHLRVTLIVLFIYLAMSWLCLMFLPTVTNELLRYSLPRPCVAWVQFNGPVGLAIGSAFILAIHNPSQALCVILIMGVTGCTLELVLDAFVLWEGSLKPLQLALDISIIATAFLSFVSSAIADRRVFIAQLKQRMQRDLG